MQKIQLLQLTAKIFYSPWAQNSFNLAHQYSFAAPL